MTEMWCEDCGPIEEHDTETGTKIRLSRSSTLPLVIEFEKKLYEGFLGTDGKAQTKELEDWLRSHGFHVFMSTDDVLAVRKFGR
eukprot:9494412-Pyramimonas_sp.AAC.1